MKIRNLLLISLASIFPLFADVPSDEEIEPQGRTGIMINVILEPLERVEVYPEVFEEVQIIRFKLGEPFKKGDLLLKMKNQPYISLKEKAESGLELAKEDIKIKLSLYENKLISTLEILQADLNLATAKNDLDQALKNYEATRIIAPFNGRIGAVYARKFERPLREKPMLEIFNDQKIIAKFIIPSSLLPRFRIGQTIPITIKSFNRTVQAKIIRIGGEINPVSGTVNVEAEIDNADRSIIPGMASTLEIEQKE